MLHSLVSSLVHKTTLAALLLLGASFASPAYAQIGSPVATPSPTPEPQMPVQTTCSAGFIEAYKRVVVDIKTISVYAKQGKQPPNMARAVRSCNKLEKSFANYQCEVGTQTAKSTDMAAPCEQIRVLAGKLKIEVPAEVPPPKANEVTNDTPVVNLALEGLYMLVKNEEAFKAAATQPKLIFFIEGKTYDFAASIMQKSPVRCTLVLPNGATEVAVPKLGAKLRSSFISEEIGHDNFITKTTFVGVNWTLDCSKQVFGAQDTGTGMTFGELKTALGDNAEITYEP